MYPPLNRGPLNVSHGNLTIQWQRFQIVLLYLSRFLEFCSPTEIQTRTTSSIGMRKEGLNFAMTTRMNITFVQRHAVLSWRLPRSPSIRQHTSMSQNCRYTSYQLWVETGLILTIQAGHTLILSKIAGKSLANYWDKKHDGTPHILLRFDDFFG